MPDALLLHNRTGPTDWQGHRTLVPCGIGLAEAQSMCRAGGGGMMGDGQSRAHNDRRVGPESARDRAGGVVQNCSVQ